MAHSPALDPDIDSVDGPESPIPPDLDTEPIYWRLKIDHNLADYQRDFDQEDVLDDEGDDCLSEDQIGLDLTAPPPESWYHGRISRHTACARLEMISEPGAYLIRESETQPGDYAISYLSRTGHVHHFKINSNCGDYYIGGRQFFSLGDLIGFYANCSCILQNESLEVPVVPPQPVPLYMMLRATASHSKTPGTDELSIVPGEVFVLLSRLNDDWGWGRSQRTLDSGLIPIVIMEDVNGYEPNLGKPWFHGSITRDDAVNLLMRKGDVGSFLVRTGSSVSGSGEIKYSLAVRTPDRVQRFLITKYDTGYYVFGGRPFNTVEDIIERYKNEVILDGIRLGSPVAQDPVLLQRMQADRPAYGRARANSIAPKTHGDIAGKLLLRKGKKSPVSGKWKEFFFILKYDEQKLLYYEHENSHRAKGLLDLKQCRVYAVHPSLYGRNDCFVVMLRYLNELSFYYICANTAEGAEDWLRFLRQCTHPSSPVLKPEVQQLRSLALSVRDCKLAKGGNNIHCLASIDGACIARTRVAAEVPCIFDENFLFEDLPTYSQTLSIDVHSTKNKGFPAMLGRDTLGRVLIHLSDLPNGQNDDQWHHLLTGASRTARGSLRLVANFKHEVILPLEEYRSLKEVLLGEDLTVIEALASVCKDHHAQLASTLVQIFCEYNKIIPITTACIAKSIEKEENVSTLFRANTLATMLMDQFMKLHTSDYLKSILKEPIQQILESQEPCELNPNYLPRGADLTPNLDRLEAHLQNVITSIFNSTDDCLPTLRYIFRCLQEKVIQKWPTDETVRTRSVSGFLFLRFICPALLKPQLFNLITESPSPMADRTLKLVTKGVQNLANLVDFRTKEPFMTALNPFIVKNLPRMRQFIDDLANYGLQPAPMSSGSAEVARDLATIYHLCCTYEKGLLKVAQKQAEVANLLKIMQTLKAAEKKYLNKGL